jgi:predicted Zn-dependent peptidase
MSRTETEVWPEELPPLPIPASAGKEKVHSFRLGNGLTIWAVRRANLPLVSVGLSCAGGRRDDSHALPGLSSLLAEGLKEGSEYLSAEKLHEILQAEGGGLTASAGPDALTLVIQGLASGLPRYLEILSGLVQAPAFPQDGIARVRSLAEEEIETQESEPSFLAARTFAATLFPDHPYSILAPTRATIASTSPGILMGEARRRLRPERMALIAVGSVDPDALFAEAQRHFGGWEPERIPESPLESPDSPQGSRRILVVARPGSVQTYLLAGKAALSRRDPDVFALALAMTAYGDAFTSRLVTNLRTQKGYTYSPGAGLKPLRLSGYVRTVAAVRNEVTGAALNEIFYELDRMGASALSDDELERSRMRDLGLRATNLQTTNGLLGELAEMFAAGLPPESLDEPVEKLFTIGKEDIRRVARRHLASYGTTVVAVGDRAVIEEQLSSFGPLEMAPEMG